MKKVYSASISLLAILFLTVNSAQSSLIVYENFNYTAGSTLAGNGNWSAVNTGTPPGIDAGNLSVSGLQDSSGNRASWNTGNIQEAFLSLGQTNTTGSIFFSLALQILTNSTSTSYSLNLTQSTTTFGSPIYFRANGSNFDIGLANRTTGSTTNWATGFSLNTTIFLVGSYEFVSGAGNDVSSLWINPDSSSFGSGSAPTATLTATGGTDLTGVNGFQIRGATGSPSGVADELRIGTTWADVTPVVVPEPAAVSMLLLGLLGARGVMHRRKKE